MPGFEWKTEGETTWSEHDWQTEPVVQKKRRPRLTILLIFFALLVAAAIIYRQAQERANQTVNEARGELLATRDLLLMALAQGDRELFYSLLSGRDMNWTNIQQQLFDDGTFLAPEILGLAPAQNPAGQGDNPDQSTRRVKSVEFSPDLMEAEVVTTMQYVLGAGENLTRTVTMDRTEVYRRGGNRWLLAPPLPEFWGKQVRLRKDMLTLTSPERDEELVGRLATDLDSLLLNLCQLLKTENCQEQLPITVHFETQVDSLVVADDESNGSEQALQLSVPAPSLVGLPTDESSYGALYQAYAKRITTAVVARLSGWQCCAHAMIYQALLEWEMSQLGLGNWPVTREDYFPIVDEELEIADIAHFWLVRNQSRLQGADGWQVYLLLDFLINRFPGVSVAEMQRELSQQLTLQGWLATLYLDPLNVDDEAIMMTLLEADWVLTAFDTLEEVQTPPIPLPEQDILLTCAKDDNYDSMTLYGYHPANESWTAEVNDLGLVLFMNGTADDDLLVLSAITSNDDSQEMWQTHIWDGKNLSSVLADMPFVIAFGPRDPTEEHLVLLVGDEEMQEPSAVTVEIDECLTGECDSLSLGGLPVWSPNGQQALIIPNESLGQTSLTVGDRTYLLGSFDPGSGWGWPLSRIEDVRQLAGGGSEPVAIGRGGSPFWLTDTIYGYVRRGQNGGPIGEVELVLASIADDQPGIVWQLSDLTDPSPSSDSRSVLSLLGVMVNPIDTSRIYLAIGSFPLNTLTLYALDLEAGLKPLFDMELQGSASIGISPDGRWLTVAGIESWDPREQSVLGLYDVEAKELHRYTASNSNSLSSPAYDWSEDGDWLAVITRDNALTLIAPEYNYRRLIAHGFGYCSAVAWLNR